MPQAALLNTAHDRLEVALTLHRQGDLEAARRAYESILGDVPGDAGALMGLGLLALQSGDAATAVDLLERSRLAAPRHPAILNNLALALDAAGRREEAVALWRRVIMLAPRFADALVNLGNARARQGDADGARRHYQAALAIDPGLGQAAANLGEILVGQRRYAEAVAHLSHAARLLRTNADIQVNLGRAYSECGHARLALDAFEAAVRLAPGNPAAESNRLLAFHYCDDVEAGRIFEAHREAAARLSIPHQAAVTRQASARRGLPLRVGVLSGDFNDHAVMRFFLPALEAADPERLRFHAYYTGHREDACTERVRARASSFTSIAGLADPAAAERIRADDLDVLIDLAGHSAGGRFGVVVRRPAPVQLSWIGYLDTEGTEAIDHRLTDAACDPVGLTEAYHVESLWRLETMWCYEPPANAPATSPPPALAGRGITFGSTNNPAKLSDSILRLWAALLRRVAGSRIVLHAHDDRLCRDRISRLFADEGIDADRVSFIGRRPLADYFGDLSAMDIVLDTWPYSGGTTTCDALWMGVPVVTLAGERPYSRTSASVLTAAGAPDWIAHDPADYLRIATGLASDVPALCEWRDRLREQVAVSRLCDARRFASQWADALEAMRSGVPVATGAGR